MTLSTTNRAVLTYRGFSDDLEMLLKNEARTESKAGVLRRLIAEKTVFLPQYPCPLSHLTNNGCVTPFYSRDETLAT